ncbi:L,D-transpeptidase family protein [Microcoleus sp. FACHB-53]|nr:L,D-transpeptidase family protein [Microcoleus sp. FACHB-53]
MLILIRQPQTTTPIALKDTTPTSQRQQPAKTAIVAKKTGATNPPQPPAKTAIVAKKTGATNPPQPPAKTANLAKKTGATNPPQPPAKTANLAKKTGATNPPQPLKPSGKQKPPASKKSSVNPPSQAIDPKSLSKDTHLVIKLGDRRVYVYKNKKLKVSYPIGIGKAGWETPTGNYKVMDMQPHPIWEEPWTGKVILEGPNNPLGVRWIGFWTDGRNSIGFHGTPAEKLVGQAVSHGCIRMRNRDVVALYEQVKMGTPVTVKP